MANNLKEAADELLKFTCLICDKYLTVPPIYISGDGTKYRCGRCKDIQCEANIRCVLLENIAGFLTVPCIYTKCKELLSWREVEKHEKLCIHRTMTCPIYFDYNCRIEIEMGQLLNHLLAHHKNHVQENQLSHTLPKNSRTVSVMVFKDIPYLVFLSYEKVVVAAMKSTRLSTYNLKISGISNSSPSLLYEGQKIIEDYVERIHCCKCLAGSCKRKSHPYSSANCITNNKLEFTSVELKQLLTIFGEFKKLTFTIEVLPEDGTKENDSRNVSVSTDIKTPLKRLNIPNTDSDTLRKNFECPICRQLLIGPIFNCQAGHPICNNCKLKLDTCPSCQAKIESSRNFPLEGLAEILNISCSNQLCDFAGNLKELTIHEENCLKSD